MSSLLATFLGEQERRMMLTGLSLGLIHVLAGPDHLSALAALAVGTSYKSFMLGFRWGLGHSTGLIVVAIVFIALKGDLDLRKLGRYCDTLVGLFMITLGCYGVMSAIRDYQEKRKKRDPDYRSNYSPSKRSQNHPKTSLGAKRFLSSSNITEATVLNSVDKDDMEAADHDAYRGISSHNSYAYLHSNTDSSSDGSGSTNVNTYHNSTSTKDAGGNEVSPFYHDHHLEECAACAPCVLNMHDPTTQRILSFVIGLLHGVAGPGGILGVLPAVEMQRWQNSVLYLSSFIFASTLSMGTFAALYGEVTRRIGATTESMELLLSVFSAGMSIFVGVIWFVFSLLGKLEDFFH